MLEIVGQIEAGRPVVLCQGPDDICDGLTEHCRTVCDHDCSLASTMEMDHAALAALRPLLPEAEQGGSLMLTGQAVKAMRSAFAAGTIRLACKDCLWRDFCTSIADDGFSGTKLFTPA